jgi:hypothetical protein
MIYMTISILQFSGRSNLENGIVYGKSGLIEEFNSEWNDLFNDIL